MKKIILCPFQFVKYLRLVFLVPILILSNTAHADLTVSVEPNNRGIISFLSDCNIVLSIGSDAEIDLSKLLIKLNGDDVTKEIRSLGKAILSEDKRKLNISYPARASDFHQGEYTFEVSTTSAIWDKAALNIQDFNGKAICINCDSTSRSLSDADLNKVIEEEETRAAKKTTKKPKIDGACGSSNGSTLASKPSSKLCNSGTSTNVKGSGPWTWNCNGANGGKNAVCSAKVKTGGTFCDGWCTYGVAKTKGASVTLNGKTCYSLPWSGNAIDWYHNATSEKGSHSKIGAIVVFKASSINDYAGHVGIIIDKNGIQMKSMNMISGKYVWDTTNIADYPNKSYVKKNGSQVVGYIYHNLEKLP